MEQNEGISQAMEGPDTRNDADAPGADPRPGCRNGHLPAVGGRRMRLWLLGRGQSRGRSDDCSSSYVYALGRIEPRFPSLAVEKEFAQATGRADTAGLTDRQALHAVLSERQNRYLARHSAGS